jgi:hypothetical protein
MSILNLKEFYKFILMLNYLNEFIKNNILCGKKRNRAGENKLPDPNKIDQQYKRPLPRYMNKDSTQKTHVQFPDLSFLKYNYECIRIDDDDFPQSSNHISKGFFFPSIFQEKGTPKKENLKLYSDSSYKLSTKNLNDQHGTTNRTHLNNNEWLTFKWTREFCYEKRDANNYPMLQMQSFTNLLE